jgi:hypothetical protein
MLRNRIMLIASLAPARKNYAVPLLLLSFRLKGRCHEIVIWDKPYQLETVDFKTENSLGLPYYSMASYQLQSRDTVRLNCNHRHLLEFFL